MPELSAIQTPTARDVAEVTIQNALDILKYLKEAIVEGERYHQILVHESIRTGVTAELRGAYVTNSSVKLHEADEAFQSLKPELDAISPELSKKIDDAIQDFGYLINRRMALMEVTDYQDKSYVQLVLGDWATLKNTVGRAFDHGLEYLVFVKSGGADVVEGTAQYLGELTVRGVKGAATGLGLTTATGITTWAVTAAAIIGGVVLWKRRKK